MKVKIYVSNKTKTIDMNQIETLIGSTKIIRYDRNNNNIRSW
jgi:hypothetical protein